MANVTRQRTPRCGFQPVSGIGEGLDSLRAGRRDNNMLSICTERPLTPSLSPAGGEGGLWPGEGDLYYIESKLV